jgi:Flp pilus assembly protein TadG
MNRLPAATDRNFVRDQDGTTAVEFALVSSALIALVLGICYVAIMLFNNLSLEWALANASRLAEINKSVTQITIAQAVNTHLASMNLPNATVVYTSSVSSGGLRTAQITAGYYQTYTLPLVSTFNIHFSANITVPQPG